jgi:hypothetical protein
MPALLKQLNQFNAFYSTVQLHLHHMVQVLGQAFGLSHLPPPDGLLCTWATRLKSSRQSCKIYSSKAYSRVILKSTYAAGIPIMTCSETLEMNGTVDGKGEWIWYSNIMQEPEVSWNWEDFKQAMMETESLPRDKTNWVYTEAQRQSIKPNIYVPEEVLNVFDKAREHLRDNHPALDSETGFEVFRHILQ